MEISAGSSDESSCGRWEVRYSYSSLLTACSVSLREISTFLAELAEWSCGDTEKDRKKKKNPTQMAVEAVNLFSFIFCSECMKQCMECVVTCGRRMFWYLKVQHVGLVLAGCAVGRQLAWPRLGPMVTERRHQSTLSVRVAFCYTGCCFIPFLIAYSWGTSCIGC